MNKAFFQFLSVCIFLFGLSTILQAQENDRITHRKIMFPGETHHFYIMTHQSGISVSNDITYFWFKNNAVHHSQGGFDGVLIDGPYVIYYPNNDLKAKGEYSKGRKHGVWKTWYENGKLSEQLNWKNGQLQGESSLFDSTGALISSGYYSRGLKHGIFTYYQDGMVIQTERYQYGRLKVSKVKEVKQKSGKKSLKRNEKKVKKDGDVDPVINSEVAEPASTTPQ